MSSDYTPSLGSVVGIQGIILTCPACGKYHVPGSPCVDTRSPGGPQSETHGIQAVRRHFGRPLTSKEAPSSTLAIDLAKICRDGNVNPVSHPLLRLTRDDWRRVRDELTRELFSDPASTASYADAPTSITEARAQREGDASKWTPRDVLIALLRDIDSGHIAPETLVVAHASADLSKSPGFVVSSPSGTHTMGVLSQIYFRLGMRISDPPCTCP